MRVPPPLTVTLDAGVKMTLAATVRFPEPLKFRLDEKPLVLFRLTLLKTIVAAELPLKEVATGVLGVLKLIVLAVVNEKGVAAVVLTIQLPRKLCVSEFPALKVAVPEIVRSPFAVIAPPVVFAPLPLKLR